MALEILTYILTFIFGIVFGSFFNVIIYRIPNNISIVKGRSFCPKCNKTLKAIDLVPIFSQVFLKSKCRYCKERISIRYPIIELLTGLLFVLCYFMFGLSWEFVLFLFFWSMLLITFIIDLEHMAIYDSILIFFTIPAVLYVIFLAGEQRLSHVFGCLAGFGAFFLIYFITKLIYKREAFGFGDVLLVASIGLFLGLRNTVITCILSFIIAAIGIIILKIFQKNLDGKTEVPFAPYICIAAFIASMFGDNIFGFYINLF